MSDIEQNPDSIEISLIDSIAAVELGGIGADLSEIALDAVLDDGLLKDIPVVGTIVRLFHSAVAVRDIIFLKKILLFLNEIKNVPHKTRQKFSSELAEDSGSRRKAGEALALLLDRLDDINKPKIIGRLYLAKLENRISYDELRRYCMFVDRSFLPDLIELADVDSGGRVNEFAAPYLAALGLVVITGKDWGTISGIGAETWYEVSELGSRFSAVAFPQAAP